MIKTAFVIGVIIRIQLIQIRIFAGFEVEVVIIRIQGEVTRIFGVVIGRRGLQTHQIEDGIGEIIALMRTRRSLECVLQTGLRSNRRPRGSTSEVVLPAAGHLLRSSMIRPPLMPVRGPERVKIARIVPPHVMKVDVFVIAESVEFIDAIFARGRVRGWTPLSGGDRPAGTWGRGSVLESDIIPVSQMIVRFDYSSRMFDDIVVVVVVGVRSQIY